MKNIISAIFFLGFTTLGFSQVIIGDDTGTISAGNKQGVLLEFAKSQTKVLSSHTTVLFHREQDWLVVR